MDAFGGTIEDHLEIERLLYRYALAIDTLDVEAMVDCFAPDGVVFVADQEFRNDVARTLIDGHRGCDHTMHIVLNHLYSVRGETASGVTYGKAIWLIPKEGQREISSNYARYIDELVKQDGRWVFLKRRYEPLFATLPTLKDYTAGERRGIPTAEMSPATGGGIFADD